MNTTISTELSISWGRKTKDYFEEIVHIERTLKAVTALKGIFSFGRG